MAKRTKRGLKPVSAEFEGAVLGDTRLDERLSRIVSLVGVSPGDSFPEQMEAESDLEGLYRFFANPKVTVEKLLSSHVEQSHRRANGHELIRVLHDSTSFSFRGEREGLGILARGAKGFRAHVALAVAADETRDPLGVLGLRPFIHHETKANRRRTESEKTIRNRTRPRAEKESSRWEKLALDVSSALPSNLQAIHVMDQEADDYPLFSELQKAQLRFVVRISPDRRAQPDALTIPELLVGQPTPLFRKITLSARPPERASRQHAARDERIASLKIRWGEVTLHRSRFVQGDDLPAPLFAVQAFEPDPPSGEEPMNWLLLTSERVETIHDAAAVVDHYRARWIIEEYFKALKTGCSFEKRQLTSFDGLCRALAMFIPMAWHLLLLRHRAQNDSSAPVFTVEQLKLLRALLQRRRHHLPPQPSARDLMMGVAALGGHIKNNGEPGWLVLGRGFSRFLEAEVVWQIAREM
jgi:Transposase DNA-binding/Transposase DDE domain